MNIEDKNEEEFSEEKQCKEENVQEESEFCETKEEAQSQLNKDLAEEYLNLARVIQADFDNYRKRSVQQIDKARIDGIASTVEVLLPSLDAFKKVKENVLDEKTLQGIDMLERAIINAFERLGVEKIDALGLPLDPNVHNALAIGKDEEKEDGIILEEFQAGYKMGDKVIRCSQVLVNKLD